MSVWEVTLVMWQEEMVTCLCVWKPPFLCFVSWFKFGEIGLKLLKVNKRVYYDVQVEYMNIMIGMPWDLTSMTFLSKRRFSWWALSWSCLESIFSLISLEYLHSSHIVIDMFLDYLMTNYSHVYVIFKHVWF